MFNELYDIYNDEDSDLISLYKITNNFKNEFNKLLIYEISNKKSHL